MIEIKKFFFFWLKRELPVNEIEGRKLGQVTQAGRCIDEREFGFGAGLEFDNQNS